MRAMLWLACSILPLAGCLDSVLPDVVLPKTLDLEVRYEGGSELDGVQYEVWVEGPDGARIVDEAGSLVPGAQIQVNATFESVGPYKIHLDVEHPQGFSFSQSLKWDFRIVCRTVDHLEIDAVFEDDDLQWDASDSGAILCL